MPLASKLLSVTTGQPADKAWASIIGHVWHEFSADIPAAAADAEVVKRDRNLTELDNIISGSAWDLSFSLDPLQSMMIEADGGNEIVHIMDRVMGTILADFGAPGLQAGQFTFLHSVAQDSKGNLYTGETINGRRIQKFVKACDGRRCRTFRADVFPPSPGAGQTLLAGAFAYAYAACEAIHAGSFSAPINPQGPRTWMELLFLSVAVLSSVGMSDILPVTGMARALVML